MSYSDYLGFPWDLESQRSKDRSESNENNGQLARGPAPHGRQKNGPKALCPWPFSILLLLMAPTRKLHKKKCAILRDFLWGGPMARVKWKIVTEMTRRRVGWGS